MRAARRQRIRRQSGYALLIILLLFALLALTLAQAAPGWITAIQRQREQTAIDYARQYCMGIRRYYHKFGTYPPNLDRLQATNDVHYLRRAWPDPLAKNGKWYFIHPGDLIAPKVKGVPGENGAPGGPIPAGNPLGGSQTGSSFGFGSGNTGVPAAGGSPFGALGSSQASPSNPGASPFPGAATSATGAARVAFGLPPIKGGAIDGIEVLTGYRLRKQDTTFSSIGGGPIIGVAILNHQPAVHEFNGKDLPDQWLFIYDPAADRSLGGAAPQGPVAPGASTPNGTNNPFGGSSGSPFGSPANNPLGGPSPSPNPGGAGPAPNPGGTGGTGPG